eukprot:COSAG06_NODE_38520_length_422_cov_1.761610_1_plen_74_part_00
MTVVHQLPRCEFTSQLCVADVTTLCFGTRRRRHDETAAAEAAAAKNAADEPTEEDADEQQAEPEQSQPQAQHV